MGERRSLLIGCMRHICMRNLILKVILMMSLCDEMNCSLFHFLSNILLNGLWEPFWDKILITLNLMIKMKLGLFMIVEMIFITGFWVKLWFTRVVYSMMKMKNSKQGSFEN